jgi:hypothetical protein
MLGAIADLRSEGSQEFVLDADAMPNDQARRLMRPLLACLATKSAAEAGTAANIYGGHLSFQRPSPNGPVWILGEFQNQPGSVRVMLRRSVSPPAGDRYGTVPRSPLVARGGENGDFTRNKFKGIKIEATGQNIVSVGDGIQVNAQYQDAANALVDLKGELLKSSTITESQKLDAVADIDSIQSQLAKSSPNQGIVRSAWEAVKKLDTVGGLTDKITKVARYLGPFLR